jgi:hypothetical protein
MRTLNLGLLAVVTALVAGCADDPEQSISGVFPSSGFIGRKVRVEVSGDNASFKDGVQLDFGAGVTVSSINVASPTAIFAELTIADSAALGARDVVVKNGSDSLTLKQAFVLQSPVEVEFQGTLAQGSVVSFTALNLDLSKLYDSTCGASIFGICLLYSNMEVVTPTGVTAVVDTVEPFRMSGTLYVDIDAMPGDIKIVSGPTDNVDKQVTSAMGKATEFMPRTPTTLAAGTATTATVAAAFDSHLYSFDAAAPSVGRYSASPSDMNATPTIYILPASGHFAELVAATARPNVITEAAGKYFAVYADNSGLSGYSYALRVNPVQLVGLAESDAGGANNTSANAQNAMTSSTILVTGASVSSDTDEDWFRFTVPTGSAAKKVHVVTGGSDRLTDTYVEIYANSEATMIAEGADSGYHEDVLSPALGAGTTTIFVKIYGSPGFFDSAHSQYVAAIWLE